MFSLWLTSHIFRADSLTPYCPTDIVLKSMEGVSPLTLVSFKPGPRQEGDNEQDDDTGEFKTHHSP